MTGRKCILLAFIVFMYPESTRENYQMPVRGVDNYGREANIGDNRLCFVYFPTTRSKHTPCWASIPCLSLSYVFQSMSFSLNVFLSQSMSFSLSQCLSLSANVFLSRPMSFSLNQELPPLHRTPCSLDNHCQRLQVQRIRCIKLLPRQPTN